MNKELFGTFVMELTSQLQGGRKLKKITIILVLLLSLILSGCNSLESKITEEQAKQIVVERHASDIGEIKIISITKKFNKYVVEWENEENCEKGIHSVNKNGEIKLIEYRIC